MRGLRNHAISLEGRVVSVERAFVYGKLFHLFETNCPALVDGSQNVYGEVITYRDDGALLAKMDALEESTGDPNTSRYLRIPRVVHFSDHKEVLDVYLFAREETLTESNSIPLQHGDWRVYLETGKTA